MPERSVQAVITSPPYNIRTESGNKRTKSFWKGGSRLLKHGYDGHDDLMPHDEYVEWQRNCLDEMMRLLRDDGAIFYNHKWRTMNGLLQDRADIVDGFPVRQIVIWDRANGFNFNPNYFLPTYEVVYLIAKPAFKLAPKANAAGCVWRFAPETGNPHPAPFPLALARRCVDSVGKGPVLDPFMGFGTTAIAAEMSGIPWIGIEKSSRYVEMANERLRDFRKQPSLEIIG